MPGQAQPPTKERLAPETGRCSCARHYGFMITTLPSSSGPGVLSLHTFARVPSQLREADIRETLGRAGPDPSSRGPEIQRRNTTVTTHLPHLGILDVSHRQFPSAPPDSSDRTPQTSLAVSALLGTRRDSCLGLLCITTLCRLCSCSGLHLSLTCRDCKFGPQQGLAEEPYPSPSWYSITIGMASPTKNSSAPPAAFPAFLFPSLSLPFRRRRPRHPEAHSVLDSPFPPVDMPSPVPSLSSSATSTCSDSNPASPTDQTLSSSLSDWGDAEDLLHESHQSVSDFKPSILSRIRPDVLRCGTCSSDIAFGAQMISKGFTGRHGRAFLVSPQSALSTSPPGLGLQPQPYSTGKGLGAEENAQLANIKLGREENRQLVTGQHVVADISCAVCGAKLGWKYVDAREPTQRYKVGKYILETQRVVLYRSWEDVPSPCEGSLRDERDPSLDYSQSTSQKNISSALQGGLATSETCRGGEVADNRSVVFDSDDDDECDEIFSGTWDPALVAKRRRKKLSHPPRGKTSTAA